LRKQHTNLPKQRNQGVALYKFPPTTNHHDGRHSCHPIDKEANDKEQPWQGIIRHKSSW